MRRGIFFQESLWKSVFLVVLCICFYGWPGSEAIIQKEVIINWDAIREAFERYEAVPTQENSRLLLDTIPEHSPTQQIGNEDKVYDLIESSMLFHKNVIAGNECLAEAAFRLYCIILPGDTLEELEYMLAEMLKRKPELYLKLLKKYKDRFDYRRFPLFVTRLVDVPEEEYLRELKNRIKALESVEDPDYLELKGECIRLLEEVIKKYLLYDVSHSGENSNG